MKIIMIFLFLYIDLLESAFSRFDSGDIVKLLEFPDNLAILELFHGPTLAFKDLALVCVGQFMEYFLSKRKTHCSVLVGILRSYIIMI